MKKSEDEHKCLLKLVKKNEERGIGKGEKKKGNERTRIKTKMKEKTKIDTTIPSPDFPIVY